MELLIFINIKIILTIPIFHIMTPYKTRVSQLEVLTELHNFNKIVSEYIFESKITPALTHTEDNQYKLILEDTCNSIKLKLEYLQNLAG